MVKESRKVCSMAHERDLSASFNTMPAFLAGAARLADLTGGLRHVASRIDAERPPEDAPSAAAIRLALAEGGPPEDRHQLAVWLLAAVDREARIVLRPIALRYRRDGRELVEDLGHDVLVLLFDEDSRILRAWDPTRGMKLRSFVALIVRRYIFRRFKGFRGNPWSIDPAEADVLAGYLDDGIAAGPTDRADIEYRLQLDRVLTVLHRQLNARDWRLFVKLYVDQHTPAEVAVEEDIRENSVHKWNSRIQKRIRKIFEKMGVDDA